MALRELEDQIRQLQLRIGELTADTGWTDLTSVVTLSSGWSYVADAASWKGIKARRRGGLVQLVLGNVRAAAGTFNVTVDGNIANSLVLNGVPAEFRPVSAGGGALAGLGAGPTATFMINDGGNVYLSALAPSATLTATTANVQTDFSATGFYFG